VKGDVRPRFHRIQLPAFPGSLDLAIWEFEIGNDHAMGCACNPPGRRLEGQEIGGTPDLIKSQGRVIGGKSVSPSGSADREGINQRVTLERPKDIITRGRVESSPDEATGRSARDLIFAQTLTQEATISDTSFG